MRKLNPKEQAVLDCIRRLNAQNGYSPSVRDIGAELGYQSTSTVQMYLDRLEALGCIRRAEGKSRSILLAEPTSDPLPAVKILREDALARTDWEDGDFDGELPFSYRGELKPNDRVVAVPCGGAYWVVLQGADLPAHLPCVVLANKTLQAVSPSECVTGEVLGALLATVTLA